MRGRREGASRAGVGAAMQRWGEGWQEGLKGRRQRPGHSLQQLLAVPHLQPCVPWFSPAPPPHTSPSLVLPVTFACMEQVLQESGSNYTNNPEAGFSSRLHCLPQPCNPHETLCPCPIPGPCPHPCCNVEQLLQETGPKSITIRRILQELLALPSPLTAGSHGCSQLCAPCS